MGDINFSALGAGLVESLRDEYKDFLESNASVAAFVRELGERYAYRMEQLLRAEDADSREFALNELRRVENTIAMEFDAIAHEVEARLAEQFKAALRVVLNFAIQQLPAIIEAVKR